MNERQFLLILFYDNPQISNTSSFTKWGFL